MNLIHLKIVFGTLDLLGSYMVMGLFASRLWLLSEDSVVLIPLIQRFGRFYLWSLTTLILGSISHFIVNALILGGKAGLWQTFSLMGQILMESHFGHAWLIHFIALAVLILGYGFCRKRLPEKDVSGFFLLINALLLLSITAIGRSGNFGNFTVIELIDWTHLVATAILGGSFITLTYLLPAGLVGLEVGKRDELQMKCYSRLSWLLLWTFLVLLASGLFEAYLRLGEVSSLWYSSYGHVFIFKMAVAAVMLLVCVLFYLPKSRKARLKKNPFLIKKGRFVGFCVSVMVVLVLILSMILMETPAPANMKPVIEKLNGSGLSSITAPSAAKP